MVRRVNCLHSPFLPTDSISHFDAEKTQSIFSGAAQSCAGHPRKQSHLSGGGKNIIFSDPARQERFLHQSLLSLSNNYIGDPRFKQAMRGIHKTTAQHQGPAASLAIMFLWKTSALFTLRIQQREAVLNDWHQAFVLMWCSLRCIPVSSDFNPISKVGADCDITLFII